MKKILKIFITMLILIILLLLYSRFIGTIGLNTKEYTIEDNNISNDFDGIKIVHFSDMHYKRIITKDRIDKIINEINLINPDIVIFTGDLIDQDSEINEDDITYLKEVLSKINAKYGKYSVIGNHDYSIDIEILRSIYKESNFNLLENSYDIIYGKDNNKLYIGGISTGAFSDIVLNKMKYDEESYKIIILHEPDYTDEIISLNPNLIFTLTGRGETFFTAFKIEIILLISVNNPAPQLFFITFFVGQPILISIKEKYLKSVNSIAFLKSSSLFPNICKEIGHSSSLCSIYL